MKYTKAHTSPCCQVWERTTLLLYSIANAFSQFKNACLTAPVTLHPHEDKPKCNRQDAPAGSVIVKRKFDVVYNAEHEKNAIQSKYSQNTDKPVKKSGLIWCFRNRQVFSAAYVSCYNNYPRQQEQMPAAEQYPKETIIQKGCH